MRLAHLYGAQNVPKGTFCVKNLAKCLGGLSHVSEQNTLAKCSMSTINTKLVKNLAKCLGGLSHVSEQNTLAKCSMSTISS